MRHTKRGTSIDVPRGLCAKSNPNPNPNPNPTTKQHAIVNIQLNIVTCPTYPDKSARDTVVAPSVPLQVVIVILPLTVASVDRGMIDLLRSSVRALRSSCDRVMSTARSRNPFPFPLLPRLFPVPAVQSGARMRRRMQWRAISPTARTWIGFICMAWTELEWTGL